MNPFQRATLHRPPVREFLRACMAEGMSRADAKVIYRKMGTDACWKNDRYQVLVDEHPVHGFPFPIVHLSIKRLDKQPIHDWRDLQWIKNQLCGPDREAIELYPAESRRVDTSNQYHLFVMPPDVMVPCGWTTRYVTDEPGYGAIQRPGAETLVRDAS